MKRYKNKLFTTLLLIVALVTFSSCENDEYWKATTLNFETEVPIDPYNGRFNYTIRILDTDITRMQLLEVRTLNSWLIVSNMVQQDRVTLRLFADGGNISYDYMGTIYADRNGEFPIDDNGFKNFMADVIDAMRYKGYVDITITGTSNIGDGGPLIFTFNNSLDIYVRD